MEITFQNKRDDFEAFYDYMVNVTEEGKRLTAQAYRQRQLGMIIYAALWGALAWGVTGSWQSGLGVFIVFLVLLELMLLLQSRGAPRDYLGKQIYRSQEKSLKPKDIQVFQLPRTLKSRERLVRDP